jgi:hypothetical protein
MGNPDGVQPSIASNFTTTIGIIRKQKTLNKH